MRHISCFWKGRLAVALALLVALSLLGVGTGQAAPADTVVIEPMTASGTGDVARYQCNAISVGDTTGGVNIDGGTCTDTTTVITDSGNTYAPTYDPALYVPSYYIYNSYTGVCDWYDVYGNYVYSEYC